MTTFRSIQFVANGIVSLSMAEQCAGVHSYRVFFIHSSADGHLGGSRVLATVNSAVVNTGVHAYLLNYCFLGIYVQEWDWWIIW